MSQLVAVAVSWASELGFPFALPQETIVERVETRVNAKGEDFKKALNAVLHLSGESFKLSKGNEWGAKLADYLADERESEAQMETYSDKN